MTLAGAAVAKGAPTRTSSAATTLAAAAIAARWCRERGDRLRTFSVGTAESADLAAARRVAAHLGTEHFERTRRCAYPRRGTVRS
ncbi:asparagine synthase-related protein [Amycolatopsis sp. NPDC050768]|uniref:asparagine synthase-related protein n=1 Tax=unclassified Amycolatopsis TaxID=2618356 RepID=UPI001C69728F|nr:hypothetical protein K1T34_49205 [Amycolatopsis sp. DSM 110486]